MEPPSHERKCGKLWMLPLRCHASRRITAITRLRLDAALYEPAPVQLLGTLERLGKKGARLPTLTEILTTTH